MKAVLDNLWIILIVGLLFGFAISFLLKLKSVSSVVNTIINDTLKINGKWSRTSLTMFTAWMTALWSYIYDLIKNGFSLEAFTIIVGVALGSKITDAYSKKLNPEIKSNETINPQNQ